MVRVALQHGPQVVFVKDEQAVGGFVSDGADEPFGVGVSSRTICWDLRDLDAFTREDGIERGSGLAVGVESRRRDFTCADVETLCC
ncbi:hypothetical protein GCM10027184_17340 [Saccharothrix stipae]